MSDKRVELRILGRVQGVAYRDWTRRRALELGLVGHVRNRRDGSVEALLSGPADAVDEMIEACADGPPAARVAEVKIMPAKSQAALHGFDILPTA